MAFQNEFLIARGEEVNLVATPDLITILDAATGELNKSEPVRCGFHVAAVDIPCDRRLRTEAELTLTRSA